LSFGKRHLPEDRVLAMDPDTESDNRLREELDKTLRELMEYVIEELELEREWIEDLRAIKRRERGSGA
jgi:hypothetical protein